MFGFIKRLRHRDDDFDYGDIKSGVLGKEQIPDNMLPEERYDSEFGTRPVPESTRFDQPARMDNRFEPGPQRFGEPFSFGEQPMQMQPAKENRDYDILEKLNLIETNLLAIRSQTETINERLKNLEMKLTPRRY